MTQNVIITHAGFGYRTKAMEGTSSFLVAMRGEELDVATLDAESRKRGEQVGAWGEPTARPVDPNPDTQPLEPAPFTTVDELSAWLKATQPNAPDTVSMVGPEDGADVVARATLLLQAESDATGGKPRKSVREPLEAIIGAQDGGEAKAQADTVAAAKAAAAASAKA